MRGRKTSVFTALIEVSLTGHQMTAVLGPDFRIYVFICPKQAVALVCFLVFGLVWFFFKPNPVCYISFVRIS